MHDYYVYILECADESYYVGVTNDIERRFKEHSEGYKDTSYTHNRRPVILKHCEYFKYVNDAIRREKQLKGWSRKKKEMLFDERWEDLKNLAACKNGSSHVFFKKEN